MQLDHVTIRTRNMNAAREFFLQVFDLHEGSRPQAIGHIPDHWLYVGDRPLVHIIGNNRAGTGEGAKAIDHVGIRLEGYAAFRAKLKRLGIRYSTMDLAEIDERRLFVQAPGSPLRLGTCSKVRHCRCCKNSLVGNPARWCRGTRTWGPNTWHPGTTGSPFVSQTVAQIRHNALHQRLIPNCKTLVDR
jgi:glyoxylase I family protein